MRQRLSVGEQFRRGNAAAGDIVENRPPLSRWHPDYAEAFADFVKSA